MGLKDLIKKAYFRDGKGIIINDSCLNVLKEIPDNSIDLIVTDPPYKTTSRGISERTTTGGLVRSQLGKQGKIFKHNDIKFDEYLPHLYRVLKENSHCYIMTNNKNIIELQNKAIHYGFHFIKNLIWNKGNKIMGQTYMGQYEYIVFLRKGKHKKINDCGTADILEIPNKKTKDENGNNIHDTEKPIELMDILINNSSNEKDIIFEPFAGVGATLISAKKNNRRYIGVELDKKYCEISANRLKTIKE